jgi:hypothetical protein
LIFPQGGKRKAKGNHISRISHSSGEYTSEHDISNIFTEYYKGLLGTPQAANTIIQISQLGHSTHDLSDMINVFSEEEITSTVLALTKGKSARPDGFPAEFYQKYWPIVKADVIKLIQVFCHNELDL